MPPLPHAVDPMRSLSRVRLALAAALSLGGCAAGSLSPATSDAALVPVVSYEEALSRGSGGEAYRVKVDGRALRFGYPIDKANVEGLETDFETIVVEADGSESPDSTRRPAQDLPLTACTKSYLVVQHPDGSVAWPSLGSWTICNYESWTVQE